jgi:hypothetical protein
MNVTTNASPLKSTSRCDFLKASTAVATSNALTFHLDIARSAEDLHRSRPANGYITCVFRTMFPRSVSAE